MNRTELVDAVGERLGDRRAAAAAVEAVLDSVTTALADGQKVSLFGFGVFEKVDRAARTARNPATGGTVEVPATAVPRFRPGQALKDAVNGRSSGAAQRRATQAGPAPATRTRTSARPADDDADGTKAGTGRAGTGEAGTTKADGSKASARRADGKKASANKAKSKADGKKADGKKADGKKADGKKASAKKADAKKSDGRKAGTKSGTKGNRSKTG